MSRQVLDAPKQEGDAEALSPTGDVFVMPCSVSQKRFWMLEEISPGNTALLIPIALRLRGPLQIEALEETLQIIVARHEILRTHFSQVEGEPRQIITEKVALKLQRLDLREVPESQREQRVIQAMADEADRPISLALAPLLHATLIAFSSDEHVLMLTAHHIISDGWSSGVLVREISQVYDALVKHQVPILPPLAVQYADYAVWQDEWLKSAELDRQLAFWQDHLRELPVLDVPTDFMRSRAQAHEALLESRLLPAKLTEGLKNFCRTQGVTLFMIFSSAYLVLLHRYSGQQSLLLATTGANRNRPELEDLIGLFANILLLRVNVPGNEKFSDFLRGQRTQLLESFAHSDTPLERVLEEISLRKSGPTRAQLQTHFLFQKAFMQASESGGLEIRPLYSVSPGSTFELAFGIVERREGIRLQMEYRTSLFRQETIALMLRHFEALLEAIVAEPDLSIDELSLFSETEREDEESRIARALAAPMDLPFSLASVLAKLDRELEFHFQSGPTPFCPVRELPQGLALVTLDNEKRLQPVGIVGDLYLVFSRSGRESIAEFESSPEVSFRDYGFVRTGFQGRTSVSGQVETWGRTNDLVRLSGFRFNLCAVDARLRLHPAVNRAKTFLRDDGSKLVAFVTTKPGASVADSALLDFLHGEMSDFLLPAAVIKVAELPDEPTSRAWLKKEAPAQTPTVATVPLQGVVPAQLRALWEDILRVSDIGPNDNFFDLGGNSFLALRMMKDAEKIVGHTLPLSLLFSGATIAELSHSMVTLMAKGGAELPLVAVQTRGSRPPLFFLHGDWVGGGFYSQRISRELGADQPFYALAPYRTAARLATLQEMARQHVADIRGQTPHGPYAIGGYCIGALVAVEVARELRAQGEEISRLILVDPPFWPDPWLRRAWPWVNGLGEMLGWSLERKIAFFDRQVVPLQRSLRHPANLLKTRWDRRFHRAPTPMPGTAAAPSTDPESEKILDGPEYSLYFLAYRLHQVTPLSVPTSIFFSESTSVARMEGVAQTAKVDSARTTLSRIPGNHTTCVTQDISSLGAQLRVALGLA